MDKGSLTIGVIITILCIIPFVVMRFNSKKRNLTLIDNLRAKAQEVSAIINDYEICGSFIIGIDEQNNFIFFHQEADDKVNDMHVNLKDVKECKVLTTVKGGESKQLLERLELGFVPIQNKNVVPSFELFNDNSNSELGSELIIAKEWARRINKRLTA